jgi:hypothetical protein
MKACPRISESESSPPFEPGFVWVPCFETPSPPFAQPDWLSRFSFRPPDQYSVHRRADQLQDAARVERMKAILAIFDSPAAVQAANMANPTIPP